MVEYKSRLDSTYHSLSDPTRRDILLRVSQQELSIREIAEPYEMSFAAVAKHVAVLESAMLVQKRKVGKQQIVRAKPEVINLMQIDLEKYMKMWEDRFEALDELLK